MKMQNRLVLSRLDQVRALADPLRLRLVEALVAEEHSVAELARVVRTPVTRLYHHMDLLLEAGLVEVTRRVPRRGTEERFYRALAREYRMDGSLLDMEAEREDTAENLVRLSRSVLGGALDDLSEGIREGRVAPGKRGKGVVLQEQHVKLTAKGFAALARELPAWLAAFATSHATPRGQHYRVVIAAFPSRPRRDS
ncbi:MAG TPA: helix-turn-helix domain-containing protein [Gemmatimonadales bacterium]|nr:helix-turn-helix domain-containing protein [Gemmatimonadales bacterium]